MPVTVSKVLIMRVVGLCLVIANCLSDWCSLQDGTFLKSQGDIALQVDGIAEVGAFRQGHHTTAFFSSLHNGLVDGRRVDMHAIAHGSAFLDVNSQDTDNKDCCQQQKRHSSHHGRSDKVLEGLVVFWAVA